MSTSRPCAICGSPFQPGSPGAATAVACPACLSDRGQTVAFSPGEEPPPPAAPLTIPLKPGTVFRGLRIDAVLGKGGMGVVHRARQISLDRDIALKLLWPRFAPTEELVPRFEREAKLLASLNHPNIVHVYDSGSEGGLFFLCLEFVDGSTLSTLLEQGKGADVVWLLRILADVSLGLQKIHEAGLVHRDLKPANIFVTREGVPKIGDFGLAIETQDSLKLTQKGVFIGSPHYVSPEHVKEETVDGRSDLYALGVILYEGLAGEPPFAGATATSILLKHIQEAPPDLTRIAPSVAGIVKKLLAKNPDDRYPTAAALRGDLLQAIQQLKKPKETKKVARPAVHSGKPVEPPAPRRAAPPPPPDPAPAGRKIPWPWVAAGAATLAVAVVLLVVLLSGPGDPRRAEPPPAAAPSASVRPVAPPPPPPAPAPKPEPPKDPAPAPIAADPSAAHEQNCPHGPFLDLSRRQVDRCRRSANLAALGAAYCDLAGRDADAAGLRRSMAKNLEEINDILVSVVKAGHSLSVDEGLRGSDRVRRVEGQDLGDASRDLLGSVLTRLKPGTKVEVLVDREGKDTPLELSFAELPAELPGVLLAAGLTPVEKPAPKPPPPAPVAAAEDAPPKSTPPAPAPAPPRRLPVPDTATQKKAEKTVRELFPSVARTRLDRLALARRMMDAAKSSTTEDPAVRWVLLRDARDLSAEALDLDSALASVAATAEIFDAKPDALKAAVVAAAKKSATSPEDGCTLAESLLVLVDQCWLAEDFEGAAAFAKDADAVARAAKAVSLADRARDLGAEAAEAKKDRDAARKAAPEDAVGGRYLCLWRSRWGEGLPLLEKSADPILKGLAAKEAARQPAVDLAQGWWDASQRKDRGAPERRRYLLRAAWWCDQAWPGTAGLQRARILKRLDDIESELPGRGVNLLARMDAARDSVETPWTFDGARLISSENGIAKVQIPYVPPAEYDLIVTAARRSGSSSFNAGLVSAGRRFVLSIDGFSAFDMTSIDRIDGKQGDMNETRLKEKQFADDRPRTLVFSVRRSGVATTVDGRRVVDWKGDPKRLSLSPAFAVPDDRVLFLMTGSTSYEVTRVTLIPISNPGQKLR